MEVTTRFVKTHPVLSYVVLTLGSSFAWWSLIFTAVPLGSLIKQPMNPWALLYMVLGAMSPGVSALLLTRAIYGKGAQWRLLARLGIWRNGWMWLVLLIPWTLTVGPVALYAFTGGEVAWSGMASMIPMGIFMGAFAGTFEEFGWRGFLLPHLQKRYSPFISALLVGLVWGGMWHFYGDWIAIGGQGWRSLLLVVLQAPLLLTADSVLLTWLYNRTWGSMLLCVLFHFSISCSALIFGVTYPTYEVGLFWTALPVVLWCATAAGVVLLNKREMLRTSASSTLAMPAPDSRPEILAVPGKA